MLGDGDVNYHQKRAASPNGSVWVSASAGTGKTTVLTNRILSLLLSGANPSGILCLTYTKAAATEMFERIMGRLSSWALQNDEILLEESIASIYEPFGKLSRHQKSDLLKHAKNLLNEVLDLPSGLQIFTIHAFCQSILKRFPSEAKIIPNFELIDDLQKKNLLKQVRNDLIVNLNNYTTSDKELSNKKAIGLLYKRLSVNANDELFEAIIANRIGLSEILYLYHKDTDISNINRCLENIRKYIFSNLERILKSDKEEYKQLSKYDAISSVISGYNLFKSYMATSEVSKFDMDNLLSESLILEFYEKNISDIAELKLEAEIFKTEGHSMHGKTFSGKFEKWLNNYKEPDVIKSFVELGGILLNGELKDIKQIGKKGIFTKVRLIPLLAQQLLSYKDLIVSVMHYELCRSSLLLAKEIIGSYQSKKLSLGVLDFDDLIITAANLLNSEGGASWVMYKLDQRIDHILVDEAQDTSIGQWQLIRALCSDFFSETEETPEGEEVDLERNRTVFVVGDEKQSIYSFQGASREAFISQKDVLLNMDSNNYHYEVDLINNFRSAEHILQFIDLVFRDEKIYKLIQNSEVKHQANKSRCGYVEMWPIYYAQKPENDVGIEWLQHENRDLDKIRLTPKIQLINDLVEHIAMLCSSESEQYLSSKYAGNQRVRAGDIMVLVRNRGDFVALLEKKLKERRIPVSDSDKIQLYNSLEIQDLISLAKFCLLSDDNLSLAETLVSPLFNLKDNDLIELSRLRNSNKNRGRKISLFSALAVGAKDNARYKEIYDILSIMREQSNVLSPYEFFIKVLVNYNGADNFVKRMGRQSLQSIRMFLNEVQEYLSREINSLSLFVDEFGRRSTELKLDNVKSKDEVRILTVHGSKGLQAPIVILPYTNFDLESSKNKLFLMQDEKDSTIKFPLLRMGKGKNGLAMNSKAYNKFDNYIDSHSSEEDLRLLYVALSRAEDRLYICGFEKSNVFEKEDAKAEKNSWYSLCDDAMKFSLSKSSYESEEFNLNDLTSRKINNNLKMCYESILKNSNRKNGSIRSFGSCYYPQHLEENEVYIQELATPDKSETSLTVEELIAEDKEFSWLVSDAVKEKAPTSPLSVTKDQFDKISYDSPLLLHEARREKRRFFRGTIIHNLLQFLANVPLMYRKEYCLRWLEQNVDEFEEIEAVELYEELSALINTHKKLFTKNSRSEVPVVGNVNVYMLSSNKWDKSTVSGAIDRLVINDDEVLIVDYKSNEFLVRNNSLNSYIDQLNKYDYLIKQIYQNRKVRSFLLWTKDLRLDELVFENGEYIKTIQGCSL